MSAAPQPTREEVSAAIAEKAWKDEAFHKAILANPNQVYQDVVGQPVPEGLTIKVLEDTPTTVHFVLPLKPANANELSDAELEQVAGGATPATIAVGAASMFAVKGVAALTIQVAKKNW